jgi:hypothetical protein
MRTHDLRDPVVGSRVLRRVAALGGAVACSLAVALHWPDIAYHLAILPLLIGSLVALVRDHAPGTPADPVA